MATIKLDIVTAERQILSEQVNSIVAPGVDGELGILPHHAPLMTMLQPGELLIRKGDEETYMAVTGGFLEVKPDEVIILADACERSEEIDIERAEAAKKRAEERLKSMEPVTDHAYTEAALRRAIARLKVASKSRRKRRPLQP